MDGFAQAGGVMQCIIALLFALADLAEGAATAPRLVRARMLMVLRFAEPTAQSIAFVAGRPAAAACEDDSPAAALQLALRLRMLACLLLNSVKPLLQQADRPSGQPSAGAPGVPCRLAAPARLYLDTS